VPRRVTSPTARRSHRLVGASRRERRPARCLR
jgi:hypothetical protein